MQRLKIIQSKEIVTRLPKFKVDGMQKKFEACQLEKHAKHAFPHERNVSRNMLEIVHFDVWGRAKTRYMGNRYYVTFIDDHTRKVWVYFMKKKSEVFTHFWNFKVMEKK